MHSIRHFFATSTLAFDLPDEAASPTHWLAFLDSIWPTPPEKECIKTLQLWFGYCLQPGCEHQRPCCSWANPVAAILGPLRPLD